MWSYKIVIALTSLPSLSLSPSYSLLHLPQSITSQSRRRHWLSRCLWTQSTPLHIIYVSPPSAVYSIAVALSLLTPPPVITNPFPRLLRTKHTHIHTHTHDRCTVERVLDICSGWVKLMCFYCLYGNDWYGCPKTNFYPLSVTPVSDI